MIRRPLLLAVAIAGAIAGAVALGVWWRQRPVLVAVDLLLVRGAAWDPTAWYSAELFLEDRPRSRIRLVTLFNDSEPADSPASIARLKKRGVHFFLSTHPSSHALASLQEFRGGEALAINAAAASYSLSGRDDGLLIARTSQRSPRRVLVLQDTTNPAYGTTALAAFRDELERLGSWELVVCPLRVRDFDPGRDRKLLMADIDAVYILAGKFQPVIGNLSQLVHQIHPGVPILLTPWARSPDVIGRGGTVKR